MPPEISEIGRMEEEEGDIEFDQLNKCSKFCKYKKTYYLSLILLVVLIIISFAFLYKILLPKNNNSSPSVKNFSQPQKLQTYGDIDSIIDNIFPQK